MSDCKEPEPDLKVHATKGGSLAEGYPNFLKDY